VPEEPAAFLERTVEAAVAARPVKTEPEPFLATLSSETGFLPTVEMENLEAVDPVAVVVVAAGSLLRPVVVAAVAADMVANRVVAEEVAAHHSPFIYANHLLSSRIVYSGVVTAVSVETAAMAAEEAQAVWEASAITAGSCLEEMAEAAAEAALPVVARAAQGV
jgi:hypothetical protein